MKFEFFADDLKRAMKGCKEFLATDDARPILKKICIKVFYDSKAEITALDGNEMVTYYTKVRVLEGTVLNPHDILINPINIPKGVSRVVIDDTDDDFILIDYGFSSEKQIKVKGDYIEYHRVMLKEKPAMQIAVNHKLLENAMKAFKGDKVVLLNLYDPVKGIQIDSEQVRCLVLPVRNNDDKLHGFAENRHKNHE